MSIKNTFDNIAYIIRGGRGTGKTTAAIALSNAMNIPILTSRMVTKPIYEIRAKECGFKTPSILSMKSRGDLSDALCKSVIVDDDVDAIRWVMNYYPPEKIITIQFGEKIAENDI